MDQREADFQRAASAMEKQPQCEFACAILIDSQARLLLQQRDNIPGIMFPGKVGLFGGSREGNET
jgi:hypothetical protein